MESNQLANNISHEIILDNTIKSIIITSNILNLNCMSLEFEANAATYYKGEIDAKSKKEKRADHVEHRMVVRTSGISPTRLSSPKLSPALTAEQVEERTNDLISIFERSEEDPK